MGKHRRLQQLCSDSSSDTISSSSDDDTPQLLAGRYQQADIAFGLEQRGLRLAAILELQEIFDQGLYSSADKKLQQMIYEDLTVAAQQRDSRSRVRQAVSALMTAAKRVLPQKQRQQLAKVEKQAAVAASRAARREAAGDSRGGDGGGAAESDDDYEGQVVFSDVPMEVVQVILQHLDPISLAAAACVCSSWYQLATCDDCWRQHLELVCSRTAAKLLQQQQQGHHCQQQRTQPAVLPQQQPCHHQQLLGPLSAAVVAEGLSIGGTRHHVEPTGGAGGRSVGAAAAAAAAAAVASGGMCLEPGGLLYRVFAGKAQKKPTALLRWTSCRALPPLCPLEWCLPATSAAAAAHTASNAQLQGRLCDPRVVGGAARSAMQGLPPGPKQQTAAARAAATARQAARACPAQHLPHQYAGPAVPGMPAPLTPAQAVRWMTGLNGRALTFTEDADNDCSSGSGSSSSSGEDSSGGSEGGESHAAAHAALKLWSIGRR